MSLKLYKSIVNIGGELKTVVQATVTPEDTAKIISVDQMHHILIFDRSGSMWGEITNLIENAKLALKKISSEDFVSILWFSGAGQFKTLIKGAKNNSDLEKLLDSLKSTVGCTCFSEVLGEANAIIEDLKLICPNVEVTMFTDGETVTSWGTSEERTRIMKQLDKMKDSILAFNTIGYGRYNKELLLEMSKKSQYGVMTHSSRIEDFLNIFENNYKMIQELGGSPLKIYAKGAEILYLTSRSASLTHEEIMVKTSDKKKNHVFVILAPETDSLLIDGHLYSIKAIDQKILGANEVSFLIGLAYQRLYNNDKKSALHIMVKSLTLKYYADAIINAFTYDEIAPVIDALKVATFSPKDRILDQCNVDYIPAPDAFCIMDLFKLLAKYNAKYIPSKNYERIGLKTTDNMNLFKADKDFPARGSFEDLVFNKEKLNVSIQFLQKGSVNLLPADAEKVGLPNAIGEVCQFRNHTIIKDGDINIKNLQVEFFDADCAKVFSNVVASKYTGSGLIEFLNPFTCSIYIPKLPIINELYAERGQDLDYIMSMVERENELQYIQKYIKYHIEKVKELHPEAVAIGAMKDYTPEQIEVLKKHGISDKLAYNAVSKETTKKEDADSYIVKTLEFQFKGFTSIPKVEDAINIGDKKQTPPIARMIEAMDTTKKNIPAFKTFDASNMKTFAEALKYTKCELVERRAELSAIKMAMVITGDTFKTATKKNDDEFIYINNMGTLIIKRGKEQVYY